MTGKIIKSIVSEIIRVKKLVGTDSVRYTKEKGFEPPVIFLGLIQLLILAPRRDVLTYKYYFDFPLIDTQVVFLKALSGQVAFYCRQLIFSSFCPADDLCQEWKNSFKFLPVYHQ